MCFKKCYFPVTIISCLLFFGKHAGAQITLSPKDTIVCPGVVYTIYGTFSSQINTNNTDDYFSDSIVNIGFPFVFYGDTVTQCVISPNNFITFNTALASQHSAYIYNTAVQNGELDDVIMFPFQDLDMGPGTTFPNPNPGRINYQTLGSAPNRKFIVEFCTVPIWSCNSTPYVTDQLILYENTNVIEMHIKLKASGCTAWGGTGIEGLRHNNLSDLVPGRDIQNVNWSATNDGRRFTPNGVSSYILDTIPFNPASLIENVDSSNIVWYEAGNAIPIDTGGSITITANVNIPYYIATISGSTCNDTAIYTFSDTSWVHFGTAYDTTNVSICAGETYTFFGRPLYVSGQYDTLFSSAMGCDSFVTLNLTVNPLPDVTIKGTQNLEICEGSSIILALENPSSYATYQWSKDNVPIPGGVGIQITIDEVGNYSVTGTTDKGCQLTSKVYNLVVHSLPIAKINPLEDSSVICAFDTLSLSAQPGVNYDYRWIPEKPFRQEGGAEGQNVTGVFLEPTQVVLTVYNEYGCYNHDTVLVKTKPCCDVFIPSAFSPNNDGVNDYFVPHLQKGQILLGMTVFDRLGQIVYDNETPKTGWDGNYQDGKPASIGTYMYYIQYTCADGKLYNRKESVTLVR